MRKSQKNFFRYPLLELSLDAVYTFEAYLQSSSDPEKVLFVNIRLVNEGGRAAGKTLAGHMNFPVKIIARYLDLLPENMGRKVQFRGFVTTYDHFGTKRGTIRLDTSENEAPIHWVDN